MSNRLEPLLHTNHVDENIQLRPSDSINNLNNKYTFQEFKSGPSNVMALETCKIVAQQLGDSKHNPLFLYGETGLGKTHLMQAVGHAVLNLNPHAKVMYMTSEQFIARFVTALQQNQLDQFNNDCRKLDLLMVDDVQYLAGKAGSLDEFYNTFNELLMTSKQIILASNRYPQEITELDARLTSRFSGGLSIVIDPPELENRVEILLQKAKAHGYVLSSDCARFIAKSVSTDVRELEGALNKVAATAKFAGTEISTDIIKSALNDVIAMRKRQFTISNIRRVVAMYYEIPRKTLGRVDVLS